jgi:hypothetical protein
MSAPKPIKSGTFKEQYERERQAEIDAVIAEFGGDTDAPTALTGMAQALLDYRHRLPPIERTQFSRLMYSTAHAIGLTSGLPVMYS